MPSTYDKLGIRFQYPDNWQLDEGDALEGNRAVTVYSPQGAFWSITLHPPSAEPRELAATALAALQAEYSDSESEPVEVEIAGRSISGYDFSFFYLDFTNTATVRAFRTDDAACLVLCQAEDREYEALEPVFRAITTSLLAG